MMFIVNVSGYHGIPFNASFSTQTVVMRADNWKDFQVASVLLRIQNILDIHLIHCYQGKHNPIQR